MPRNLCQTTNQPRPLQKWWSAVIVRCAETASRQTSGDLCHTEWNTKTSGLESQFNTDAEIRKSISTPLGTARTKVYKTFWVLIFSNFRLVVSNFVLESIKYSDFWWWLLLLSVTCANSRIDSGFRHLVSIESVVQLLPSPIFDFLFQANIIFLVKVGFRENIDIRVGFGVTSYTWSLEISRCFV